MTVTRDEFGWGLAVYSRFGFVLINSPKRFGESRIQFVYNFASQAWGMMRDIDADHLHSWKENMYFVARIDEVNRLYVIDGHVDDVRLNSSPTPRADRKSVV